MHQLCKHITIRMSKHMLSKSCKGAPNCQIDAANIVALICNNICDLVATKVTHSHEAALRIHKQMKKKKYQLHMPQFLERTHFR